MREGLETDQEVYVGAEHRCFGNQVSLVLLFTELLFFLPKGNTLSCLLRDVFACK